MWKRTTRSLFQFQAAVTSLCSQRAKSHQQPESTMKRESVRPFLYMIANMAHWHFTDPFGKQAFWG